MGLELDGMGPDEIRGPAQLPEDDWDLGWRDAISPQRDNGMGEENEHPNEGIGVWFHWAQVGIALLWVNGLRLAKAKECNAPPALSRRQERKGNGPPEAGGPVQWQTAKN